MRRSDTNSGALDADQGAFAALVALGPADGHQQAARTFPAVAEVEGDEFGAAQGGAPG